MDFSPEKMPGITKFLHRCAGKVCWNKPSFTPDTTGYNYNHYHIKNAIIIKGKTSLCNNIIIMAYSREGCLLSGIRFGPF